MLERLTDALKQVEGAYSLLRSDGEGLVACRDPLGNSAAGHGQARRSDDLRLRDCGA